MENTAAGFIAILIAFAVVVLILWILLPFAVFGSKDLLKELIAVNKTQAKQLDALLNLMANKKDNDSELRSLINKLKEKEVT